MQIDVSAVVTSLASVDVTRRRSASPTIDAAGHMVAGATTDTTIAAVLQRPGPDALERLAAGLRSRARWLLHTTAEIRTAESTTPGGRSAAQPDSIVYGGVVYAVVDITDQSVHGSYRRAILLDGGG